MNKFIFILGLAFVGAAAYVMLSDMTLNERTLDGADDFEAQAASWGTRKRVSGAGSVLGGQVKQAVGRVAGNPDLEGEGIVDEAAGRVKNAAGQAAQAVSEAVSKIKD